MALDKEDFNTEDSACRLRLIFSPKQKIQILQISRELNLSTRDTVLYLLKAVYLEESYELGLFRNKLNKRLKKGVGQSYILQLKLLYILIGTFLKRINSLP